MIPRSRRPPYRPGIDALVCDHHEWIRGRRVGLVAHAASVGHNGVPSARLIGKGRGTLAALFGPEHGFAGTAGAGEAVPGGRHPEWNVPIHSLYGETRKPTEEMLAGIDVLVFDLQDLGARPYTYVSTLYLVLEAASEWGVPVVVADRPTPLVNVVDGPMLEPGRHSFVGMIPSPVVYGMTPGETAIWLNEQLGLDVDVRVAPMQGYRRAGAWGVGREPWIPPSPAIRSWECGAAFPFTVFLEALPALDHGRGTETPFRVFGAPWLDAEAAGRDLTALGLPGVRFSACRYQIGVGPHKGEPANGVAIDIADYDKIRPVQTAAALIWTAQRLHGVERVWSDAGTREEFFDQLMGTSSVRTSLKAGAHPVEISAPWAIASSAFCETRKKHLLYTT